MKILENKKENDAAEDFQTSFVPQNTRRKCTRCLRHQVQIMKKEYETPKVEKMEFDVEDTVMASNGGNSRCIIGGMSVSWQDTGNACSNSVGGDE